LRGLHELAKGQRVEEGEESRKGSRKGRKKGAQSSCRGVRETASSSSSSSEDSGEDESSVVASKPITHAEEKLKKRSGDLVESNDVFTQ
jgi:hypothetical protein